MRAQDRSFSQREADRQRDEVFAAHSRRDRESRARALLEQGYHPARVAEMTAVPLGLVDRWAATTPAVDEPMRRAQTSGPIAGRSA